MDDIDQKIEKVGKLNRVSKLVWTIIFVFCLILDIYAYKEATSIGHKAFLIYIFIHLCLCLFHLFSNLILPFNKEFHISKEEYYRDLILKKCWNIDIIPLIYFIPLYLGIGGVNTVRYINGINIFTWIDIAAIAIWILSLFFYLKRRKYYFSEYKRIYGTRYFSTV